MAEAIEWAFYGYETASEGSDVQNWFDELTEDERDDARDTIVYLEHLKKELWGEPHFKGLNGKLSEIRFKANEAKKWYRIYGFFWPPRKRYSYTFLLGAGKKVSNPKKDIVKARKRLDRVADGSVNIHEFEFKKRPTGTF